MSTLMLDLPGISGNASTILQILTNCGFCYLAYFLITKSIPDLLKATQNFQAKLSAEAKEEQDSIRRSAREELAITRSFFEDTLVKLEANHREELSDLRNTIREMIALAKQSSHGGN